ncbi:zinc metallopeptidase [Bythopirellula goksoeyrii]|uniref:Neutral zinc metallopeptidase n=1 Tax=Bythopirellula goksoeyrii TaxID=1400387 RepID=A0A5B9QC22_9BACT|nr:zinc metallopeptidase [Bythopirellula goksoeyrii]QEG36508.1 Putative neutral zinc metallopeptidase [Bythopirellula goksoeyrii]
MLGAYYLIIGAGFLLSLAIQAWLRRTYTKWSRIQNSLNLSGAEVARHLLQSHQLSSIRVLEQKGKLTDHYDPRKKHIALSGQIYREPSIASAAIAAHETGHALQDQDRYGPMQLRYMVLPIATLGAQYGPWAAIIGSFIGSPSLVHYGLLGFGVALMFQVLSLPIEFNASTRAKEELESMGFTSPEDRAGASKVLFAAAMTYVANAATAMAQVLFLLLLLGRSFFKSDSQE